MAFRKFSSRNPNNSRMFGTGYRIGGSVNQQIARMYSNTIGARGKSIYGYRLAGLGPNRRNRTKSLVSNARGDQSGIDRANRDFNKKLNQMRQRAYERRLKLLEGGKLK